MRRFLLPLSISGVLLVAGLIPIGMNMRGLFAQQQEQDDESDPHEGQPEQCDNYKGTQKEHVCHCGKAEHEDCDKPAPSVRNDSKCKTNCRPSKCHCITKCVT